jgi:N-acetylmuramoyl-L-alanine amidase
MLAIDWVSSPNFGKRAEGKRIDALILHYTGMATAERALDWLCDPASSVSAHYFVFEDGHIAKLVEEENRAWHAGKSFWAGETDINSCSIGIEIANPGHDYGYRPFPDAQIDAVIGLSADIVARHPIPPQRVLAHSDVAPMRKADPGELFPWRRLADAGLGHYVEPVPIAPGPALKPGDQGPAVESLKRRLQTYGYGVAEGPAFDAEMAAVVRAFQRHFRPGLVDGIADVSTTRTLDRLLAALPRDSAQS